MEQHTYEDMVTDPAAHFESPDQVLESPDLSIHLKQKILNSWKLDAKRLADSASENMSGGEPNRLREVSEALLILNEETVLRRA
jgi:hypothetical protein